VTNNTVVTVNNYTMSDRNVHPRSAIEQLDNFLQRTRQVVVVSVQVANDWGRQQRHALVQSIGWTLVPVKHYGCKP
jgi:hypothetical protein